MIALAAPAFAQGPLPLATPSVMEPEAPRAGTAGESVTFRGITVAGGQVVVPAVVKYERGIEYGAVGGQLANDRPSGDPTGHSIKSY